MDSAPSQPPSEPSIPMFAMRRTNCAMPFMYHGLLPCSPKNVCFPELRHRGAELSWIATIDEATGTCPILHGDPSVLEPRKANAAMPLCVRFTLGTISRPKASSKPLDRPDKGPPPRSHG